MPPDEPPDGGPPTEPPPDDAPCRARARESLAEPPPGEPPPSLKAPRSRPPRQRLPERLPQLAVTRRPRSPRPIPASRWPSVQRATARCRTRCRRIPGAAGSGRCRVGLTPRRSAAGTAYFDLILGCSGAGRPRTRPPCPARRMLHRRSDPTRPCSSRSASGSTIARGRADRHCPDQRAPPRPAGRSHRQHGRAGLPGKGVVDLGIATASTTSHGSPRSWTGSASSRSRSRDPGRRPARCSSARSSSTATVRHPRPRPAARPSRVRWPLRPGHRLPERAPCRPGARRRLHRIEALDRRGRCYDAHRYSLAKTQWIRGRSSGSAAEEPPIPPPATIGILGGGQLGRMLAVAARSIGYRVAVLDPDPPPRQPASPIE